MVSPSRSILIRFRISHFQCRKHCVEALAPRIGWRNLERNSGFGDFALGAEDSPLDCAGGSAEHLRDFVVFELVDEAEQHSLPFRFVKAGHPLG